MSEHRRYNLSGDTTTPDGRPLPPVHLGLPPTYDEEQTEGWSNTKSENAVASYMTEPASVARLIMVALYAEDGGDDNDDKKAKRPSKAEIRAERKEKEVRCEVAETVRRAVRNDTADQVPLSKAEVELILDRTSFAFGASVFDCVRKALREPNVALPEADKAESDKAE